MQKRKKEKGICIFNRNLLAETATMHLIPLSPLLAKERGRSEATGVRCDTSE
jgi:hypothetical protein